MISFILSIGNLKGCPPGDTSHSL